MHEIDSYWYLVGNKTFSAVAEDFVANFILTMPAVRGKNNICDHD